MELFDDIGIKDKNGNDIFSGSIIAHNQNYYLIKWSFNLNQYVARTWEGMNFRDFDWIKRLSDKHIEIVGIVIDEKWEKFHGLWNIYLRKFSNIKERE